MATDYKAEAVRSFEVLHDWQAEEGITDASMLTVAIEAQINATLYLAEQQRIANLLALASFSQEAEGGQRLFTDMDAACKWRAEAVKALGL